MPNENEKDKKTNWYFVIGFLALGIITIMITSYILGKALEVIPENRFLPEVFLVLLLIGGVIALIVALSIMVAIHGALRLSTSNHALGMPPGSIRAVLGLLLILIFAITSVFYYRQLSEPPTVTILSLTQAQLATIPGNELVSVGPSESGEDLFDIERRIINDASDDYAKQTLTLLGTLITAVAGFYFGAKSVETGALVEKNEAKKLAQSVIEEIQRTQAQ